MRTLSTAPAMQAWLAGAALAGVVPEARALRDADAGVRAASDQPNRPIAALDDWSGTFDIHLGVYGGD